MGKKTKQAIHWRTPRWIINSTCFALGVFHTQWISLVYDTRLNIPWKEALLLQKERIVFPCHHFSRYFAVSFTTFYPFIFGHLQGLWHPMYNGRRARRFVYHFHTQLPTTAIGTHAFRVPLPSSARSLGRVVCFLIHIFCRLFCGPTVTSINRLNNPIGICLSMKINQIKVNNGKYTII